MHADLTDTVALVTGAGGGIGRAAALELARRGADVAVHYHRSEAGAAETARQVEALGRKAATFTADLARRDEAFALVASAVARLGRIDVLVNNAGDLVERKPLLEMTEALWRQVLDLNLTSVLFVTQAAVPAMIERGRGVIVNVSSLAAHNGGGPGALAYAAAKGGLISLTKAMAKELAPKGVRVNSVSPGLIGQTAFHGRFTAPEAFAAIEKTIPIGRGGTPEEVGRVIAFLSGPDAAYLVGETVEVNGGMFMR
ncbi:MAG TPA: glucose 1-dehydrogenase [Vicinamibacteria bacterium]|nr:glucose 1-dehydrogenase [Vicinamibacteria bacterium]